MTLSVQSTINTVWKNHCAFFKSSVKRQLLCFQLLKGCESGGSGLCPTGSVIWVSSSALGLQPCKSYRLGAGGDLCPQEAHTTPDVPVLMRPDTRGCEKSKTGQGNHTQVRTREIEPLPVSSHPPQSAGLAGPTPWNSDCLGTVTSIPHHCPSPELTPQRHRVSGRQWRNTNSA